MVAALPPEYPLTPCWNDTLVIFAELLEELLEDDELLDDDELENELLLDEEELEDKLLELEDELLELDDVGVSNVIGGFGSCTNTPVCHCQVSALEPAK